MDATAELPVLGKNLPVGTGVSLGYRLALGLEPDTPQSLLDIIGEMGR